MFVIHAPKNTNPCERIILGHVGENMARCVVFDLKDYVQEFGAGSFTIANQRQGDALPYIVTNTALVGNTNATWYLTDVDTAVEGFGICQLRYYVDNVLCKTDTYQTRVFKSVGITGDVPDPYKDLLEDVELVVENLPLIQSVPTLAQDAADSADEAEDFANQAAASALSIDPDDFLAPTAEQMLSDKGETDTAPYLFRRSGGNGADRRFDELVGGSVVWNQLAVASATHVSGDVTVTKNNDGSVTLNGTANATGSLSSHGNVNVVEGHKYLLSPTPNIFDVVAEGLYSNMTGNDAKYSRPVVLSAAASGSKSISLRREEGVTFDNLKVYLICVDLTQMFGSTIADYIYTLEQATEGSGIAWLKSYGFFTENYYAYNTGTMLSVKTTAAETVGFNAWDEECDNGTISSTDGANASGTNLRSKNYIAVIPGDTYYYSNGSGIKMNVRYYDINKNYVGYPSDGVTANSAFVIPAGVWYIRFYCLTSYGTTYNNDICINLSGTRNGEYEPYVKRTYPLGNDELRGVLQLENGALKAYGDRKTSDGKITRRFAENSIGYGRYAATSMPYNGVFLFSFSRKYGNGNFNIICSKYPTYTAKHSTGANIQTLAAEHDKCVFVNEGSTTFYIADSSYSSLSDFNASLVTENASIVYEALSVTTESSDPFQAPMILYPDGTERFVDERSVPLPVGHETFYPVNQRAKLDGLPSDFSTLIAPTEKTNKASQNYAVGSYLIMANQLYKVTSAITTGQTITPNTNVTATTVMAEIMALA